MKYSEWFRQRAYAFLPMIWVEMISSPLTWYLMSTCKTKIVRSVSKCCQ